jgi:hypothetical protein
LATVGGKLEDLREGRLNHDNKAQKKTAGTT